MSKLDVAVNSVPAEPLPADGEVTEPTTDPAANDPAPTGTPGNEDGEPGEGKERSIENVRGEFLRKLDKSNKEMMAALDAIRADAEAARTQYGSPVPASVPTSQPQTLDDMSIAQLEGMQTTVPEGQQPAFLQYLQERKIDAKVEDRLNTFQHNTQKKQAEQRFNEQAVDRWPQLRDKASDLYRKADLILGEMGDDAQSARAVLDAANEAGLVLGLVPQTGLQRTQREPGRVAPGRRTAAPPGQPAAVDTAKQAEISASLASAMPNGFSKEALARIAERDAVYQQQLQTHVRG